MIGGNMKYIIVRKNDLDELIGDGDISVTAKFGSMRKYLETSCGCWAYNHSVSMEDVFTDFINTIIDYFDEYSGSYGPYVILSYRDNGHAAFNDVSTCKMVSVTVRITASIDGKEIVSSSL